MFLCEVTLRVSFKEKSEMGIQNGEKHFRDQRPLPLYNSRRRTVHIFLAIYIYMLF